MMVNDVTGALSTAVSADDLRRLFRAMILTRVVEDRLRTMYLQGRILGGCYTALGHEALTVGSAMALEDGDILAPVSRDIGAHLARGIKPVEFFAQHLGKATSPSHGKDGNVHIGDLRRGVIPPISMLGTNIPVAAGAALALQRQGKQRVALAYIGDGATNTGEFHEGMNFAAVLKTPLIILCENNGYAYSTPLSKSMAIPDIAIRAQAYGMPGVIVDGNDAEAVFRVTRQAVAHARAGNGPTFIEGKTFRVRGHAEHDDARYVPKEIIAAWTERDPLLIMEQTLSRQGLPVQELRDQYAADARSQVEQALAEAEAAPMPDPSETTKGVYAP